MGLVIIMKFNIFGLFKKSNKEISSPITGRAITRSPTLDAIATTNLYWDLKTLIIVDYYGFLTHVKIPFLIDDNHPSMYPLEPNGECSLEFSQWFKSRAAVFDFKNHKKPNKQYFKTIFIRMENSSQGLKLFPQ